LCTTNPSFPAPKKELENQSITGKRSINDVSTIYFFKVDQDEARHTIPYKIIGKPLILSTQKEK